MQSCLASLRASSGASAPEQEGSPAVEGARLAALLRWLGACSDVFTARRCAHSAADAPLLSPDPDCGGAVALVPARCLAPFDAGEAERVALRLPPRPLAAPPC
jgi:hypothetical protein